jgi:NADH-quinone oxidoreductase subunit E
VNTTDTVTADAVAIVQDFSNFTWTPENARQAEVLIGRYPPGRQASAVMPLLWLAQYQMHEQTGSAWLPLPVIEYVADQLGMPRMRVLEVVTFYTMYNLKPVGTFHVQVCGTTPCWLRGSDDVMAACKAKGLKKGEVTHGGKFTLSEVECLGACVNAPMVQINDDYYEDLDFDRTMRILDALERGETPEPGPQNGRQFSAPEGGETTLKEMA